MALHAQHRLSYADYLQLEQSTHIRHEFLDGMAVAMAGGTPRHSAVKTDLSGIVRSQLIGKPYRPYDSDCKIRVEATGLSTYPDLSIVCGPIETAPTDKNAVTNPTVIVEVLSPGTEAWDRGTKFEHYRNISSLQHYLLVRVDVARVEHFQRRSDGTWALTILGEGETLVLDDVGMSLDINALYSNLPPLAEDDQSRFPQALAGQ